MNIGLFWFWAKSQPVFCSKFERNFGLQESNTWYIRAVRVEVYKWAMFMRLALCC